MSFRPRSKYGIRTDAMGKLARTVDGILFASKREAKRYGELKLLERAERISELALQPRFPLRVLSTTGTMFGAARALAGTHKDDLIGEYRADFSYRDEFDDRVVEDVKGFKTPLYRWKKKHFEAQYGIQITEV